MVSLRLRGVIKCIDILFKCHHSTLYLFKINLSDEIQCGCVFWSMFINFAHIFFLKNEQFFFN